jgi:hypothetical protein
MSAGTLTVLQSALARGAPCEPRARRFAGHALCGICCRGVVSFSATAGYVTLSVITRDPLAAGEQAPPDECGASCLLALEQAPLRILCELSGSHLAHARNMTETDYLVKGAGASAMAFVDVMLRETDATFATSIGVTRQAGIGTTLIHSCACISRPHITAFLRVSLAVG